MGLAPLDSYVEPRLSIGSAVSDREFSTAHFKIQVDEEARAVFIKNNKGRVIWKCKQRLLLYNYYIFFFCCHDDIGGDYIKMKN